MYLEQVGTNSLRTTNEQLPYHQSRLSRLCELYYNRHPHTLGGSHTCTHVYMHTESTYNRTCSPYSKLPQLKSSCIKGSCLSSHFISVIFSSLTLSRLCHFTHFFSPFSFLLIPLCFSFFVSHPFSFSPFASLCSTYLPGRFSAKEKRCFLFYIHLPFLESSLFLKCRLKGSISQVILCPTTCKTRSHPHLHPQPIHQTAAASLADSCLISHKLVLPLTHFPFVSCSYSFHSPHALSRLPSLSGPHISFFFLQMPHSSPLRNVISVFSFCSVISPCPSFSLGNSSIVCCSSVPSSLISLSPSPSQCMSLRLCL